MNLEPQPESQPQADSWNVTPASLPDNDADTLHPRLRLHRAFSGIHLPDSRDVIVYLPPGYDDEPERDYPVLYMQDGQNLFDGRTSFIRDRTWQMR